MASSIALFYDSRVQRTGYEVFDLEERWHESCVIIQRVKEHEFGRKFGPFESWEGWKLLMSGSGSWIGNILSRLAIPRRYLLTVLWSMDNNSGLCYFTNLTWKIFQLPHHFEGLKFLINSSFLFLHDDVAFILSFRLISSSHFLWIKAVKLVNRIIQQVWQVWVNNSRKITFIIHAYFIRCSFRGLFYEIADSCYAIMYSASVLSMILTFIINQLFTY